MKNTNSTDNTKEEFKVIKYAPLPIGYKNTACPKCGSLNLAGAILTENADEQDPDIICKECKCWIDKEVIY